ncbi:hypothetical protein GCM10009430_37720 [Aquimarina litoralis]|uniref:IPT/TIG domain-containing protein n=1 Tax=Aquimarina litoralis TaxID=584605 RepID=A0ABN1J4I4_9FLAO
MKKRLGYFIITILLVLSCEKDDINIPQENFDFIPSNIEIPENGIFNELVKIKGENIILDSLKFYFDDIPVFEFYQPQEDSISLKIPRNLEKINSNFLIYVKTGERDSLIASKSFSLRPPKINGVNKSATTFGEAITAYGEDFDTTEFTEIYVNDEKAEILSSSKDSIQFIIPNEILTNNLTLKVNAQLQEDILDNSLNLKEPEIIQIFDKVHIGDRITIKGKNFNLTPEYSKVILNNELEASIENIYNNDSLDIKIPLGPYKEFQINSVKYLTAGMETTYSKPIEIISDYILYAKNNPLYIRETFQHDGNIFSLGSDQNSSQNLHLWKFDIENQMWSKYSDLNIPDTIYAANISSNGEMYIYFPFEENNNFLSINLFSEAIRYLQNFPGKSREYAILIPFSGKVYLGKGITGGTYNPSELHKDLFEYDEVLNSWIEVNTDNSIVYCYNDYEEVNGQYYFFTPDFYNPDFPTNDWPESIVRFDVSSLKFVREYDGCTSCHTEELFEYKNQLFLGVSNTGFIQLYNYFNPNEYLSINGGRFYNHPSKFISVQDNVFFYSNVINYVGANDGLYMMNPKLLETTFL